MKPPGSRPGMRNFAIIPTKRPISNVQRSSISFSFSYWHGTPDFMGFNEPKGWLWSEPNPEGSWVRPEAIGMTNDLGLIIWTYFWV
jgi:hypothetical protein